MDHGFLIDLPYFFHDFPLEFSLNHSPRLRMGKSPFKEARTKAEALRTAGQRWVPAVMAHGHGFTQISYTYVSILPSGKLT